MNRKHIVFITLLAVVFLFPLLSAANQEKIRVTVDNAPIHNKTDTSSKVVTTIPLGAELEVVERLGEWIKVKLPPDERGFVITGYIHKSNVELDEKVEQKMAPQPIEPTLTPEELNEAIKRTKGWRTLGWIITVPSAGWLTLTVVALAVVVLQGETGDLGFKENIFGYTTMGVAAVGTIVGISLITRSSKKLRILRRQQKTQLSLSLDPLNKGCVLSLRLSF